MKKKVVRRTTKAAKPVHRATRHEQGNYIVLLKSWMFVVMFALMLGVGAIVGSFINQQMSAATPTVAGVSVEAR